MRHALVPEQSLALTELERAVLEGCDDTALAACVRVSQTLGIGMTSIALAGGLTRTRAYALVNRADAAEPAEPPDQQMRRLIACLLSADTSIAATALANELRLDRHAFARALRWLAEQGVAEVLAVTRHADGAPMDEHWIAGPQHCGWVAAELEVLRWVTQDRYAVYVRLPDGVREDVAFTANDVSNAMTTVIEAGTSNAIRWDELAIAVAASDPREALDTARAVWLQSVTGAAPEAAFDVTCVLAPSGRA